MIDPKDFLYAWLNYKRTYEMYHSPQTNLTTQALTYIRGARTKFKVACEASGCSSGITTQCMDEANGQKRLVISASTAEAADLFEDCRKLTAKKTENLLDLEKEMKDITQAEKLRPFREKIAF